MPGVSDTIPSILSCQENSINGPQRDGSLHFCVPPACRNRGDIRATQCQRTRHWRGLSRSQHAVSRMPSTFGSHPRALPTNGRRSVVLQKIFGRVRFIFLQKGGGGKLEE